MSVTTCKKVTSGGASKISTGASNSLYWARPTWICRTWLRQHAWQNHRAREDHEGDARRDAARAIQVIWPFWSNRKFDLTDLEKSSTLILLPA